jgi:hypothetical protein
LSPPDISTPAATLETFMEEVRAAVAAYHRGDVETMRVRSDRLFQTFAIELPPTPAGFLQGSEMALYLFEVLIRVELPPMEEIPGGAARPPIRSRPTPMSPCRPRGGCRGRRSASSGSSTRRAS